MTNHGFLELAKYLERDLEEANSTQWNDILPY